MKTSVSVFIIALLFWGCSASVVQASDIQLKEYPVTLENGIQGVVVDPQKGEKTPVVLLLHGFASQKDEVGDLYKRLAQALGWRGIASLRIDFRGWGESAGEMVDSTVQGQIDDAATAYHYLSQLEFVDPARIGVIGFSLGGGIAIVSAAQHPEWYKSMAVWSSVGDFKTDFLSSLGQENFDLAAKDGKVTIDLGWREVVLGAGFFTSLEFYDPKQEISKYPGAFLAISGSEDFSVSYVDGYVNAVTGSPKKSIVIDGTDHIFGVLGEDQNIADDVVLKTADWFASTL